MGNSFIIKIPYSLTYKSGEQLYYKDTNSLTYNLVNSFIIKIPTLSHITWLTALLSRYQLSHI